MENINSIFRGLINAINPHSFCPICKSGDKESENRKVCSACAMKLKTQKDD